MASRPPSQHQNGAPRANASPDESLYEEEEEEYEEIEEEYMESIEEYEEVEECSDFEGDEEEEEDPEEDDSEAQLKYATFATDIVQQDQVTCLVAFAKFLVLGTDRGVVIVLDTFGEKVSEFRHHRSPIRDISMDENNDFVASCSQDGWVYVQELYEAHLFKKEFSRPMSSIALHPLYGRRDDRPLVCGGADGVVRLIERGRFLGNHSATTLHDREGKIHSIRWCGDYIAWANDVAIIFYNYATKSRFSRFSRPDRSPRPDMYRCCLFWDNHCQLIVAWGNWVRIIQVKETPFDERLGSDKIPQHRHDLFSGFETDAASDPELNYKVCGIAPFDDDNLLVLSCQVKSEGLVDQLVVRIVKKSTGEVGCTEILPGRGGRMALSYSMAYYPSVDPFYYIVSPDSIVVARPVDEDDRVEILLRNKKFKQALDKAKKHRMQQAGHTVEQIGAHYLVSLVQDKQYELAANTLLDVYGNSSASAAKWEKWVRTFRDEDQYEALIDVLPLAPTLSKSTYELFLSHFIDTNPVQFRDGVKTYKGNYSCSPLIRVAEIQHKRLQKDKLLGKDINDQHIVALGEALGLLFEAEGDWGAALDVMLPLKGCSEIFEMIRRHRLWDKVYELLPELMAKDTDRTVALIIQHHKERPTDDDSAAPNPLHPDKIVKRLEDRNRRDYLWAYLHSLHGEMPDTYSSATKKHAQLLVTLYAEFDRKKLLPFMKKMLGSINMRETRALCLDKGYTDELVFVMARMGSQDEGLKVIVDEMNNVRKAIQYILDFKAEEDQQELFKKLVQLVILKEKNLKPVQGVAPPNNMCAEVKVLEGYTWQSISVKHNVDLARLFAANKATIASPIPKPGSTVFVPVDLFSELLAAIADPSLDESTLGSCIDPKYLIERIPSERLVLNFKENVSQILANNQSHKMLMQALITVLSGDVVELQRNLERNQSRAIRIHPQNIKCVLCKEMCRGSNFIGFPCAHTYHSKCYMEHLTGLQQKDKIPARALVPHGSSGACSTDDPDRLFKEPWMYRCEELDAIPFCVMCTSAAGENE